MWNYNFRDWLNAVPIMVSAFTNHQNAIPTANELDQPSVARIVKGTVNANIITFGVFATMGIGGYLSWGSETEGNFINLYPADNSSIWLCRVMLAIIVYFVMPVSLLPASKSCAQLVLSAVAGEDRSVSRTWHMIGSTLCLGACTAIAITTDDVAFVMGVLGGLLATSVMFTFPAIIYWIALWPTQPPYIRHIVLIALVGFALLGYGSVVNTFL
jgi:sodium-coupled neutral amino acid transporter 11